MIFMQIPCNQKFSEMSFLCEFKLSMNRNATRGRATQGRATQGRATQGLSLVADVLCEERWTYYRNNCIRLKNYTISQPLKNVGSLGKPFNLNAMLGTN